MTPNEAVRLALRILEPFQESGTIYDSYQEHEGYSDEQYEAMLCVLRKLVAEPAEKLSMLATGPDERHTVVQHSAVTARLVRMCVSHDIPFKAAPRAEPTGAWEMAVPGQYHDLLERFHGIARMAADAQHGQFVLAFEKAIRRLLGEGADNPLATEEFFQNHLGLRALALAAAKARSESRDRYTAEQAAAIWFREAVEPALTEPNAESTASPSRFVLYDFDADELATTCVYTDYQEAADDAEQLDNVLVVPLRIPATAP